MRQGLPLMIMAALSMVRRSWGGTGRKTGTEKLTTSKDPGAAMTVHAQPSRGMQRFRGMPDLVLFVHRKKRKGLVASNDKLV